jgi:hypothetical protein
MKFSLEKTRAALWAYGMDCSTWFLVVFKPKMTYPLPPRFSAHTVLQVGLLEA